MTDQADPRYVTVSRIILAAPHALYRAHLDAGMFAKWRTPEGMAAQVLAFDGRLGGGYRVALHQSGQGADNKAPGAPAAGQLAGTFEELVPDEMIVERIRFESDDPAFAGAMRRLTSLRPVRDGTKVMVTCEQAAAMAQHGHLEDLAGALRRLALLAE